MAQYAKLDRRQLNKICRERGLSYEGSHQNVLARVRASDDTQDQRPQKRMRNTDITSFFSSKRTKDKDNVFQDITISPTKEEDEISPSIPSSSSVASGNVFREPTSADAVVDKSRSEDELIAGGESSPKVDSITIAAPGTDQAAWSDRPITRIVAVARKSSPALKEILDRLEEQCRDLAAFFQQQWHRKYHEDCHCTPEVVTVVLNGISSNENFAEATNGQIKQFRKAITVPGHVAICFTGFDGLSTNLPGLEKLITAIQASGTRLTLFTWVSNDVHHAFAADTVLGVIQSLNNGHQAGTAEQCFFARLVQMGLNKDDVAHALRSNRQIQPRGRNNGEIDPKTPMPNRGLASIAPPAAFPLPTSTDSGALEWDQNSKRKRFKEAAVNRPSNTSVIEVRRDDDGNVLCPEAECNFKALSTVLVIDHIMKKFPRRKKGESNYICPLCDKSIKCMRPHLETHYGDPVQCTWPGCSEMFRTPGHIERHIASFHKKEGGKKGDFPCDECSKKFDTQKKLTAHKHTHETELVVCECGRQMEKRKLPAHKWDHCPATENKSAACHICGATYRLRQMAAHVAKHAQSQEIQNFAKEAGITGDDNLYTKEYVEKRYADTHRSTTKFVNKNS